MHRRKYVNEDLSDVSLSWVFLGVAFYGTHRSSRPTTAYLCGAHAPFFSLPPSIEGREGRRLCTGGKYVMIVMVIHPCRGSS